MQIQRIILSLISLAFLVIGCNNTKHAEDKEILPQTEITKFQNIDPNIFFQAALEGNKVIIEQGLKEGIDVNSVDSENRTALMLASFNGHTEIVKILIKNNTNINQLDKLNRSALMFASTGPFNSTVKLLLESGAKVNIADNVESWTTLMFAAGEGQLEVVKTLIEHGADVNLLDIDGESALDFAVSKGHTEVAEYIKARSSK